MRYIDILYLSSPDTPKYNDTQGLLPKNLGAVVPVSVLDQNIYFTTKFQNTQVRQELCTTKWNEDSAYDNQNILKTIIPD